MHTSPPTAHTPPGPAQWHKRAAPQQQVDENLENFHWEIQLDPHIVVDTPLRYPTKRLEGMIMGIEQHLVALQQVGAQEEGPAVTELEMGDLQLGIHPVDHRIVFAPVELKGLTRCKCQRDKRVPGGCPPGFLPLAERQDGRTAPQRLPVPGGDRRRLPRVAYALRREAPRAFHRSAGRVRRARDAPERGVRRRPAARRGNHHAMDKTELHPLLDQCGLQFQAIGSTVLDPSRCRLASAPIGSLKHNAVSFPATGH